MPCQRRVGRSYWQGIGDMSILYGHALKQVKVVVAEGSSVRACTDCVKHYTILPPAEPKVSIIPAKNQVQLDSIANSSGLMMSMRELLRDLGCQ